VTAVDPDFLADVSALAEFVRSLEPISRIRIDADLLATAERVRCDVHDMRKTLATAAEKRVRRERVKRKAFAGAR
jgi:hypothetical protein